MAEITKIYKTEYDVGNVVLFTKDERILCGIVDGFYVDESCGNTIWYNIRTGNDNVFTYSNGGDIAEYDIIGIVDDELAEKVVNTLFSLKG